MSPPAGTPQRASSPPRWFIGALAAFGIGGGALGLAIIMWLAFNSPPSLGFVLFAPAVAAYAFGVHCGVAALRRSPRYLNRNAWFYWLQVPTVFSPALGYTFVAGAQVFVGVKPPQLIWNFHLGSTFQFFFAAPVPVTLGVNLVAVAMLTLIHRMKARERATADRGSTAQAAS